MKDGGQDPIRNLLYPVDDGPVDPHGNVADDVTCRACGYNLKALPANGRCPECGAPVGVSVWGDWIQNSRPDWVWRVARSTEAVGWANLLLIAAAGLIPFSATRLVGVIGSAMVLEFWAISLWQAMEPEASQERLSKPQWVARVACALVAGLVALAVTFAAAGMLGADWMAAIGCVVWASFIAASAGHLRMLSGLIYRAPSTELAWQLGIRWKYLVAWHAAVALCLALETSGTATCCFGLVAGIGAVGVTIGMGQLEQKAAQMLKLEARVGVENWRYHEQAGTPRSRGPARPEK